MDEKYINYDICKDGTCEILVNINGVDKGNYRYCNYREMRKDYKGQGFKFVRIISEEEEK